MIHTHRGAPELSYVTPGKIHVGKRGSVTHGMRERGSVIHGMRAGVVQSYLGCGLDLVIPEMRASVV